MATTYGIGDIHGCQHRLQKLIQNCLSDPDSNSANFVFIGDYIDRGPDSCGVLDFLIELQLSLPQQVICLKGNHEQMLLDTLGYENAMDEWALTQGRETLKSYNCDSPREIPKYHLTWLRSLPVSYDDGVRLFVHAGINPAKALNQQNETDLLWIREPFLSSDKDFGRLVVHGHTPTSDGTPDLRSNRLNIDTGAVFGGPLTAAVFEDETRRPVAYILDS